MLLHPAGRVREVEMELSPISFWCGSGLSVQDAQKENPGQFGDVLQGPGAIRPAHDVADAFDCAVDGLLRGKALSVAVVADSCHRDEFSPAILLEISRLSVIIVSFNRVASNYTFRPKSIIRRKPIL